MIRNRRGVALLMLTLLLLLSGCSSYQLAYNNIDRLLFNWVDDYVDLSSAQRAELQPLVQQWHAEHRRTQLPVYKSLLVSMRAGLQTPPVDAALFAQWWVAGEGHWSELRSSWVPLVIALLEQLELSQQKQLLDALRKEVKTQREDYLERSSSERVEYRYELYRERMKRWIGRLDRAQSSDLNQLVVALPDSELQWLAYRSQWIDELEQALLIRSDKALFHKHIQTLLRSPNSFRTEALQQLLASSRQQRGDYMLTLINGLTAQQRDHLLNELDDVIDAAEQLRRLPN